MGRGPFGWAGIPVLPKVTRCKSGTTRSRYLNNGYVPGLIQHPGQPSGRLRRQASSHIWIAGVTVRLRPTVKPPAPYPAWCRYLRPLAAASLRIDVMKLRLRLLNRRTHFVLLRIGARVVNLQALQILPFDGFANHCNVDRGAGPHD